MVKKMQIKEQIEKTREILNNHLVNDVSNNHKNNIDTLNISQKLDELIVEYMKY